MLLLPSRKERKMLRSQLHLAGFLILAFVLMGFVKLSGEGWEWGSVMLAAGSYYKALLPQTASFNIAKIIEGAKGLGFWIRVQEGLIITYFKGSELCASCDPLKEQEFFKMPSLYVDAGLFLVRMDEPKLFFNVRPLVGSAAASAAGPPPQYEIVVNPKVNLEAKEAEDLIVGKLLQLSVLESAIPLSFELLRLQSKPKPTGGLPLDSTLFALTQAPDWHLFAARNNIELSGIRARVLIELKTPDAQLQGTANVIILARSASGLLRALVLIPELIEVAKDPAVKFVRLPSRPQSQTE